MDGDTLTAPSDISAARRSRLYRGMDASFVLFGRDAVPVMGPDGLASLDGCGVWGEYGMRGGFGIAGQE